MQEIHFSQIDDGLSVGRRRGNWKSLDAHDTTVTSQPTPQSISTDSGIKCIGT